MALNKKGQAAMEFLTTYGWALLIIVIVAAVIFLVVRPAGLVGEAKVGFSGVDVIRFGVDSSADELQAQLQNRRSDRINVTNAYVTTISGGSAATTALNLELGPGRRTSGFQALTLPDNVNSGDSFAYTVTLEYYFTDVGSATLFNSTGTLSGTSS